MIKKSIKKIISSLVNDEKFSFRSGVIGKLISHIVSSKNGVILLYTDPDRSNVINLIKQIKKENEMILEDNEAYQIYMAVIRTNKIPGDIAEVGSYRGGSAKIICEAKKEKTLHVFDTFEGLPAVGVVDDSKIFWKGKFAASMDSVVAYLAMYKNIFFYKGFFPETAEPVKDKSFSFVHLDVDLYDATLASIEFFYPRMVRGGIMISHDYITSPGVKKAFDEFFADKLEPVIEMSGSQCLVVKV